MKKLAFIFLILFASHVSAQEINIAAGKEGGGYDAAAKKLARRLEQRSYEIQIENFDGSDAITLAMCSGAAEIGIAQIDAVDARAAEGCILKPIGNYGNEVAVILFPPKSKYDALDELGESNSILVGTIGSGTDLFWHTIVRIENGDDGNKSEWAKAAPVNGPIDLSDTMASFGDIDAVILVRKPTSSDVGQLLSRGWSLGELYDKDINDYQFNGSSLYEPGRLNLSFSGKRHKGYGYTVRSYYLATQKIVSDRQVFATIAGAAR